MKGIQLIYRESHKADTLRAPVIMFFTIFFLYLLIEFFSGAILIRNFLKYGFSGDGLWFVFVWIFLAFTFLLFYIVSKASWVGETEALYLEGNELVYKHGSKMQRVEIGEIYEIHIFVKHASPVRVLKFKTKNPRDEIEFGGDYAVSMRSWITPEALIEKGIEIYKILRKINSDVELTRFVPRKYRANKNAVMEIYEDGRWKTYRIKPGWET